MSPSRRTEIWGVGAPAVLPRRRVRLLVAALSEENPCRAALTELAMALGDRMDQGWRRVPGHGHNGVITTITNSGG